MASEETDPIDDEKLELYVERMSALQHRLFAAQRELNQVMREAETDGFDPTALEFLVRVRAQNANDLGKQVLTDLTKYAHLNGTSLEVVVERKSPAAGQPTLRSVLPNLEDELDDDKPRSTTRLFVTAAWGVFVAVTLLWLLT